MTGLDGHRVYLDWNATAPLRPEARAAMLAAMDAVGNPSSVHAEGRAAKKIVETARRQVARLVGCDPSGVVFSSGATEAANTVITGSWLRIVSSEIEHDCVRDPVAGSSASAIDLPVPRDGVFPATDWLREFMPEKSQTLLCIQAANSETGVEQNSYIPAGIARDTGNA
ncbi:MAG: aminotransferase class V-fold PLP-dependent enzyme, partial [Pseudomonadota bacterium]